MRRAVRALLIIVIVAEVAVIMLFGFAIYDAQRLGITLRDMDWNTDGRVTPGEILATGDIGVRPANSCAAGGREFFSFKDGLPIRIDCRDA